MRLYGTLPSHFTRKVRVLLQELRIPYDFVVLQQLLEVGPEKFAGNPLHLFPVLEDGGQTLIESNLICEYILNSHGSSAGPTFFPGGPADRVRGQQILAIIDGAMSAGVSLIRAKRSGIENIASYAFFQQERAALESAQRWLNREIGNRLAFSQGHLTVLDIALQCLVEWGEFREMLLPWPELPNLERFVRANADRPSFKATHPSLSDAKQ